MNVRRREWLEQRISSATRNRARMPGYDANVVLPIRPHIPHERSRQRPRPSRWEGGRPLGADRDGDTTGTKRSVLMSVSQSSFDARSCLFSPARTCTDVVGLATSESCLSGLSGRRRPARWTEPHRSTPRLAGKEQFATPSFRIDLSSRTAFCAVTSTSKTALGSTAS